MLRTMTIITVQKQCLESGGARWGSALNAERLNDLSACITMKWNYLSEVSLLSHIVCSFLPRVPRVSPGNDEQTEGIIAHLHCKVKYMFLVSAILDMAPCRDFTACPAFGSSILLAGDVPKKAQAGSPASLAARELGRQKHGEG